MIVKNEEANLPGCLGTVADLVDEIVVVDTGSVDRTRAIAAEFGARVYDFAWADDFSRARNASIDHASGAWIFWLDADDRLDEENRARLRALSGSLSDNNTAYLMTYLALSELGQERNSVAHHVKLFRNHPAIRWQYRVHEQIAPAIERQGGTIQWSDVTVHHYGYQDPAVVQAKLERNLRLVRLDHADCPNDPIVLFNLGRTTMRVGDLEGSLPLLRQAIDTLPAGADFLRRTAYGLMIEALCRLARHQEALARCLEGRARFPLESELLLAEGLVRRDLGDLVGARASLLRLLEIDPANAVAQFHVARLQPASPFFQFQV
jgi:tetratricopeptide (TPR) repeat protein